MILKKIVVLLVCLTSIMSCSKGLSLSKLESVPQEPEWMNEVPVDINSETQSGPYREGRRAYIPYRETAKKYLFLAKMGEGEDFHPYWTTVAGTHLLELDEDHMAYSQLKKVLDMPESTPFTDTIRGLSELKDLKNQTEALRLRVLARQGLKKEVLEALSVYEPANSYGAYNTAAALMLIGEDQKAVDMFYRSIEPEMFPRLHKRSSATAGAAALAWAMGRKEDVLQLTQWMVDLGPDTDHKDYMVKKEDGSVSSYFINQWQSSYEIITAFRELAGKGVQFDGLTDGVYKKSIRSFLGELAVEVAVKNGKVQTIEVVTSEDDRPYSALKVIPERILSEKSLKVDTVSHATVTSTAIMATVAEALKEAEK